MANKFEYHVPKGTKDCKGNECDKDYVFAIDVPEPAPTLQQIPSGQLIPMSGQMTTQMLPPQQTQQIQQPQEKPKAKSLMPNDQPFYQCKNCDIGHKNPNYTNRPNKKCTNCGSLNGQAYKGCKNCDHKEFEEVEPEELDELGVPMPGPVSHEDNE